MLPDTTSHSPRNPPTQPIPPLPPTPTTQPLHPLHQRRCPSFMTRKIENADSKSSMARNMNCIDAKHKKAKITTERRKLHDQRHNIKDPSQWSYVRRLSHLTQFVCLLKLAGLGFGVDDCVMRLPKHERTCAASIHPDPLLVGVTIQSRKGSLSRLEFPPLPPQAVHLAHVLREQSKVGNCWAPARGRIRLRKFRSPDYLMGQCLSGRWLTHGAGCRRRSGRGPNGASLGSQRRVQVMCIPDCKGCAFKPAKSRSSAGAATDSFIGS